jgi:hypothetical protein
MVKLRKTSEVERVASMGKMRNGQDIKAGDPAGKGREET